MSANVINKLMNENPGFSEDASSALKTLENMRDRALERDDESLLLVVGEQLNAIKNLASAKESTDEAFAADLANENTAAAAPKETEEDVPVL